MVRLTSYAHASPVRHSRALLPAQACDLETPADMHPDAVQRALPDRVSPLSWLRKRRSLDPDATATAAPPSPVRLPDHGPQQRVWNIGWSAKVQTHRRLAARC